MKMLKLSTMKLVTRRSFKIRPIPDNIIQELNELADEDGKVGGDQHFCDDYYFDANVLGLMCKIVLTINKNTNKW